MYFLMLWLFVCGVSAVQEKSVYTPKNKNSNGTIRWLEELKANLPKSYYCCNDGQMINMSELNYCIYGAECTNMTCIDHSGSIFNFSLKCERVFHLNASLEDIKGDVDNMEFYIEYETLYIGDHNWLKMKGSSKDVCFGNYTNNGTNEVRLVVMICEDAIIGDELGGDPHIYGHLALASLPFVLLTIVVYSLLPELRDLQGLSMLSLCTTYGISLLLIVNGILNRPYRTSNSLCRAGGLLAYFSTIASFFWMNAIVTQVLVSIRYPNLQMSWKKQFKWYSVYAWGVAGLLTFIVMVADMIPGRHVVPGLGMNYYCWFNGEAAKWTYYLGPMTLVLTSNALLFLASVVMLFRQRSSSNHMKLRYKFLLSLRLFVVVGITWLWEPLMIAHGEYHFVWMILDFWSCLQGLFLFVVLVLLRKRAMLGLTSRGYMFCLTSYVQAWITSLNDEEELVNEGGSLRGSVYRKSEDEDEIKVQK